MLADVSGVCKLLPGLYGRRAKLVLPNRFADEIRNHPDLHLGKAISDVSGIAIS